MHRTALVLALLLLLPILALADDDAPAAKPYDLGAKVADFTGKDPSGIPVALGDLVITTARAEAATREVARAYAGGGAFTDDTELAALKGLQDEDGEFDDSLKSEMIGAAGRCFGLVASDDDVDAMETVGDVVRWIAAAKDAPIVLMLWSSGCNTCVNFYNEKINEIAGEDDIRLLVIASEQYETAQLVTERLEDFPFFWKVLMDQTQVVKDRFVLGGTRSPHMFLLDAGHVLRYRGAVDDDPQTPNGDEDLKEYLRDAIRAVKAGKPVETPETQPKGCPMRPIKR